MTDEAKRVPLVFFRTEAGAEPADRDDELVALHAFIKKTRATPAGDLKLARKRKQDYERTT
ncbi:MAG: type II toxin-antitoxin system RelE/ParE family toxin [Myxococcota bacterium]|nr:type II toxin-antitoxin system RelE/ParE family toxin [Myxococcota bacterium]